MSDKQLIFDWLYRFSLPSGLLEFDELMINAARFALQKPPIDAELFAQVNSKKYWNWLLKELEESYKKGLSPIFSIKDRSSRRIVWYPNELSLSKSRKDKYKSLLLYGRPDILRKLDTLNDREFEALGCLICRLLRANQVKLTPRGNEKGIDFFASIILPARSHILFGNSGPLKIVGQCKKYSDQKVQVDKINQFITTLDEIRHVSYLLNGIVPNWFSAAKGPMIGWMIAHKGYQSGAHDKAKNHGIILSDSLDLAEIISLSRDILRVGNASQRADYVKEQVKKELELAL